MQKPRIFQGNIHDRNYRDRYTGAERQAADLIDTAGRETESLAGLWTFSIDPYDTALRANWWQERAEDPGVVAGPPDFNIEGWEETPVPSCWNLIDHEYLWYEGSACYVRNFDIILRPRERVFLVFEGVAQDGYVFLNREQIAFHRGGSTPFSVEITNLVNSGRNRLFVVANNTRGDDRVPMSNTDWFNYGGLYRDVALVRVPETFIRNCTVALERDGGISVSVQVDAFRGTIPGSPADAAGVGAAEAMDSAGFATSVPDPVPDSVHLRIDELDISVHIPLKPADYDPEAAKIAATFGDGGRPKPASGRLYGAISLEADPVRWSPENPKLYDVEIHCETDAIFEAIGFRTIEREGRRILLNGEPVFFRGVSMHEDDPKSGKTYAEAEIRRDFETALDLGCNFVRLAHYPHSRMAAQIADEMGLMLWEEIPVYWAIDFANPATRADAENQLSELIFRDRNRASVVVWSVGNENPDSDERLAFMSGLVDVARTLDPTRLVSAACLTDHHENRIADRLAEHLDLIGINEYFGWYDPDYEKLPAMLANSDLDRPVVITEFGGGALVGHRGSTDEFFTEDRQRAIYERQIDEFVKCPYIKGISPWILFDFRCPRRTNRFQRFYNRKGLVADDHETRKLAFETLQEFYAGDETDTLAEQI